MLPAVIAVIPSLAPMPLAARLGFLLSPRPEARRSPARGVWRAAVLSIGLAAVTSAAVAEVKPLPRAQWPASVAAAVPLIVAVLTPAQRSIVVGTSRENLPMLQGEWGEDIEALLGLNAGNKTLVEAACGAGCTADRATLVLMEAAWTALAR